MNVIATVTSKGQITIPHAVRDQMGIAQGDKVVFHVDNDQATLSKIEPVDLAYYTLLEQSLSPEWNDPENAVWDTHPILS